jgi:hypothetical protein
LAAVYGCQIEITLLVIALAILNGPYGAAVVVTNSTTTVLNTWDARRLPPTYHYNDLGLVSNINSRENTRALTASSSAAYATIGNLTATEANTYDNRGFRLSSLQQATDRGITSTYDVSGNLTNQTTTVLSTGRKDRIRDNYGYDNLANLFGYRDTFYDKTTTANAQTAVNVYNYTYANTYTGRQISSIAVSSTQVGTAAGITTNKFDNRGRIIVTSITEANSANTSTDTGYRKFLYNTDGEVIIKAEKKFGDSSYKIQNYYYSSEGELANLGSIDGVDISPLSAIYEGGTTPSSYIIKLGDSLMSIAQSIFGDANLWYIIADANGLSQGPTDRFTASDVGRSLRLPNRDVVVGGNARNFKSYSASAPRSRASDAQWSDIAVGQLNTISAQSSSGARRFQKSGYVSGSSSAVTQADMNAPWSMLNLNGFQNTTADFLYASGSGAMAASSLSDWSVVNPRGSTGLHTIENFNSGFGAPKQEVANSTSSWDWNVPDSFKEGASFIDLVLDGTSLVTNFTVMYSNPFNLVDIRAVASKVNLEYLKDTYSLVANSHEVLSGLEIAGKFSFGLTTVFSGLDLYSAATKEGGYDGFGIAKSSIDIGFGVAGLFGGPLGAVGEVSYGLMGEVVKTDLYQEYVGIPLGNGIDNTINFADDVKFLGSYIFGSSDINLSSSSPTGGELAPGLLNHIENLPTTNTLEPFNIPSASTYSNHIENFSTTNTLGSFNISSASISINGLANYNQSFSNFNLDLKSSSQIAAGSLTANISEQFRSDWSVYGPAYQRAAEQRAIAREYAYAMSPAMGPKGPHGQPFDLGASLASFRGPTRYAEYKDGKKIYLSDAEVARRRQAEAEANEIEAKAAGRRYYNERESIQNLEIELDNIRYPNPHELELRAQDPTRYTSYDAEYDRKRASYLEDQLRGKIDDFNNKDWSPYVSSVYTDIEYA